MEGALLRLRPKIMTVSTVVAGLLPIMWSTRVGAEVMKPLAAPVLGGMVSSLLHVLIVTPVIFSLIRERELRLAPEPAPDTSVGRRRRTAADAAGRGHRMGPRRRRRRGRGGRRRAVAQPQSRPRRAVESARAVDGDGARRRPGRDR